METKARRGDLVLMEETRSSFYLDHGTQSETFYRLAVVTACTRDGLAKNVARFSFGSISPAKYGITGRRWVIATSDNDVPAIIARMGELTATRDGWDADTFASFDDAREFLTPFRRIVAA